MFKHVESTSQPLSCFWRGTLIFLTLVGDLCHWDKDELLFLHQMAFVLSSPVLVIVCGLVDTADAG